MKYSGAVELALLCFWAIASLLLAWFVRRRLQVFGGSVVLAAPAIGYSMIGFGLLPLGGLFHALCAGLLALLFHYFFQRFRSRRPQ